MDFIDWQEIADKTGEHAARSNRTAGIFDCIHRRPADHLADLLAIIANQHRSFDPFTPFHELFNCGLKAVISEARTLAQSQHPNLVRALNLFGMNGGGFVAG